MTIKKKKHTYTLHFTNTYTSLPTDMLLATDGRLHVGPTEASTVAAQYLKGGVVQVAQGFDVVSAVALAWVAKTAEMGLQCGCKKV